MLSDEQLIPAFVQAYYAAQAALNSGDRQAAMKAYQDVLAAYKQLAASALEKPHKELAHQQVKTIYDGLSAMPSITTPTPAQSSPPEARGPGFGARDYLTIGFFAVLIVMVLFFKPEYIGLAFADIPGGSPPQWRGGQTEFTLPAGTDLAYDFSSAFRDPDGDRLVFLATESPGLRVSVSGSVVTIEALPGAFGDHQVTVMASDLASVTKVPITIHVV